MRMDVTTMSEIGNEAMIPAMLAKTARSGLVLKNRTAITNPNTKATIPVRSADYRRNPRRYSATIIGERINSVARAGKVAIIGANTMEIFLGEVK